MSLIVASSSQEGYNRVESGVNTRTGAGIEAPSSFQNHFTSPIKIPTNAEVAVESIKLRRDAVVDIQDETLMYKYFGRLQNVLDAPLFEEGRSQMPVPIKPRPGSYNITEWQQELQTRLNESYGNPEIYNNFEVSNVTDTDGRVKALTIKSTQHGESSTKNIVKTTGDLLTAYWVAPYQLSDGFSGPANWTSTHVPAAGAVPVHKLISRGATNASGDTILERLDKRECSMIGHGHVWGLVNGTFKVGVDNASSGGWRVGLSRPQIEYVRDTTKPGTRGRANLLPGTRHPDGGFQEGVMMATHYQMFSTLGRNQKDFYDYMVQSDGENIEVYQFAYDNAEGANQLIQHEVLYYGAHNASIPLKLTNASFNASYESVEFVSRGDEVELYFVDGSGAMTLAVGSSNSTTRDKCFLPISETKNALYPRVNIGTHNQSLKLYEWSAHHSHLHYRYPSFDAATNTFTTGDDFFSNNRVDRFSGGKIGLDDNKAVVRDTKDRPYCLSQTLLCDTKGMFEIKVDGTETRASIFDNCAGTKPNQVLDHDMLFTIGSVRAGDIQDYLEGKYRTLENSAQAKMNRLIGFPDKSTIDSVEGKTDGYAQATPGTGVITFTGYAQPDYRVHSAFVRISNMPIQSYNGAKQSVSKMLYHLPRFTNDGREFGDLFFSPGEKTYVALHNTSPEILNNIEVQIVDVNERPITDISGNTIVVFHLRQRM